MNAKVVGAREVETGDTSWHASANINANYHTLCGISLDDDLHEPIPAQRGQKIDCVHCKNVVIEASRFKMSDFDPSLD